MKLYIYYVNANRQPKRHHALGVFDYLVDPKLDSDQNSGNGVSRWAMSSIKLPDKLGILDFSSVFEKKVHHVSLAFKLGGKAYFHGMFETRKSNSTLGFLLQKQQWLHFMFIANDAQAHYVKSDSSSGR